MNVLDDIGKIVVRLRVEEATVVAGEQRIALRARLQAHSRARLRPRVRRDPGAAVRACSGSRRLRARSQDDAVEAVGGAVGGVSSKLRLELSPRTHRADAAAVTILRRLH